jgi:hypothetical protein
MTLIIILDLYAAATTLAWPNSKYAQRPIKIAKPMIKLLRVLDKRIEAPAIDAETHIPITRIPNVIMTNLMAPSVLEAPEFLRYSA